MTTPMVLFVYTQSFPVLCTIVLVGDGFGIFLDGVIIVTWLAMILCPLRHMTLVLYLCTSGRLHVPFNYMGACLVILPIFHMG